MRYFHCPKDYRNRPYGCGFGPVNATVAYLDIGMTCPNGHNLVPFHKPKSLPATGGSRCTVTDLFDRRYCEQPARVRGVNGGRYCRRHAYLAPTG